jgi:phage/plasmid-like protein (TIGR03299 family)
MTVIDDLSADNQFITRDVPWAQCGTRLDSDVSLEEAIQLGGMDFDVQPTTAGYLVHDSDTGIDMWQVAQGRVAMVRTDTGELFSYATSSYQPVQYRDAFAFMEEINPRFVAAGTLKRGRQGFIVTQLPEQDRINIRLPSGVDDAHTLYVILRTSQDCSSGIEISVTTLRERCMNQLSLPSLTRGVSQSWSIRHRRNVYGRMEQARNLIKKTEDYISEFESIVQRLADIDLDYETAKRTLKHVLPDRPRRDGQLAIILNTWEQSDTVASPGTGWGLVNAVDEYFEHLRPNRTGTTESRFTTGLDGMAHRMTAQVMQRLI